MSTAEPTRKNRNWIFFFVILGSVAALLIAFSVWYNLSLQLNAGQLAAAKELWLSKGPADYDLLYMSKIDSDEPVEYRVAVRDRRVAYVATRTGQILEMSRDFRDALGTALGAPVDFLAPRAIPSEELTRRHTIDAFFTLIESKMKDDLTVGKRNYTPAIFDSKLGYPIRYVHLDSGTRERIELNVRLLPPNSPYDPQ